MISRILFTCFFFAAATTITSVLQFVHNSVMPNEECNQFFLGVIQPTNICFSGVGGKSTCAVIKPSNF